MNQTDLIMKIGEVAQENMKLLEALEAVTAERDRLAKALEQFCEYCPLESFDSGGEDGGPPGFFNDCLADEGFTDFEHPELAAYLREREVGAEPIAEGCCELCGQPMPEGEEMFRYHGHSGPCPEVKA